MNQQLGRASTRVKLNLLSAKLKESTKISSSVLVFTFSIRVATLEGTFQVIIRFDKNLVRKKTSTGQRQEYEKGRSRDMNR